MSPGHASAPSKPVNRIDKPRRTQGGAERTNTNRRTVERKGYPVGIDREAHPARRHGRVLRVGGATREPGPEGQARGRRRQPRDPGRRRGGPHTRRGATASGPRCPCAPPSCGARSRSASRRAFALYQEISRQVMSIFRDAAELVEPLSLDEAFLDVTASVSGGDTPSRIAARLKERVASEVRLTLSVGAATSKSVAKIASDVDKPDGADRDRARRRARLPRSPARREAVGESGPRLARASGPRASSASATWPRGWTSGGPRRSARPGPT